MLKKAAHIILAIYLLTTIVGFTVSQHYCGDRLTSTQIDAMDECGCEMNSFDSSQHTCGMCEVETEYVHLAVNFVVEHRLELNPILDYLPIPRAEILNVSNDLHDAVQDHINISPPPIRISRRLALIQSFLC